jgi:hypothetical protein
MAPEISGTPILFNRFVILTIENHTDNKQVELLWRISSADFLNDALLQP